VGLELDNTVITAGYNGYGQLEVGGWIDISQVAAGCFHTVGVQFNGRVVAASLTIELTKWNLGEAPL
jgi:hypothetical protein